MFRRKEEVLLKVDSKSDSEESVDVSFSSENETTTKRASSSKI